MDNILSQPDGEHGEVAVTEESFLCSSEFQGHILGRAIKVLACEEVYPNYLKYLTATIILQIAIYGKNFCTSAKEAFYLLMRNVVR